MPTLDWIGKKAVVDHHREVPFHLLRENTEFSVGDAGAGNLLVQGDNLLALKALLPYYAGQVKCIYIDPPYNTGNEGWVYNDNVNSPEIRRWLGEVVGREAEDLSRHDKWLCMMYPRLMLLREFLREDGAIFVSIDDNEVAHLRLLMNEVFGARNFIENIVWHRRVSPANDAQHFSSDHDHILVFARNIERWRPNRLSRTAEQLRNYQNPDEDPRGPWNSATYTCNKTSEERPNLYYAVKNPNTGELVFPRRTAVWKYDEQRHLQNVTDNLLWWGSTGTAKMPRIKRFLSDMDGVVPRSVFSYDDSGHTQEARTELLRILPDCPFATPKPTRLLRKLLQIATSPGDLILDSFAGSGTTGHAVMQLNAESPESAPRRFILCEMLPEVARDITAERLRRVSTGYGDTPALGGGFRYCELGPTLFDARGRIREEVTFEELARHVYFVETGEPLPEGALNGTPLLGVSNGTAVYLLYNGILRDRSANGGNALTRAVLASLPPHDGPRVVYGTSRRVSPETLSRENVVFRQTPYEIRTR